MVTSCCFYFAAIQQPTAIMTEAVMNVRVMGSPNIKMERSAPMKGAWA